MGKAKLGWHHQILTMLYSFDQDQIKDLAPRPALADETDEQIMTRMQHGDETALAALLRRHRGLFRTIISRMINNDHDVDDVVQECLLEVWRHAADYRVEKGHALGWIVTLIRRRTIDRIRRKAAYGRAQDRFREASTTVCEAMHSGADEVVAQNDRAEVVTRLLAHLPPAQQEVVQLAYYRGLSQRQIAAQTGIPLGTIKTRLELAMRKLRSAALAFGELRDPLAIAA